MKRVLFFAVAMAAALSCSETELDNLVIETPASEVTSQQVTFSVAMNDDDDATRVAVNDDWSVVWEDGDALLAYGMPWSDSDEPEQLKCEMLTFDESESAFTATVASTHRYRLIYPYIANANISDEDYTLSIDLTSQSEGATMNYMTTESTVPQIAFGEAYSPTMKHIGAAVILKLYLGAETYDDYTIDNVVVSGLNGRATVVLNTPLSNSLFYKSVTSSPITVEVANNKTISDGEAQLRFNIMPTVVTSDLPIVVTATLTSSEGTKVMLTQSITVESDVEFARSSYNTINCRAMTTTGTEYWIDLGSSSLSSFGGGSGTSSSPYLISTAQHMADFAAGLGGLYSNDHFQLQNDIDLSGRKWSLYDAASLFCGTFDGNGYKISGLYVDESSTYKGLFYKLSGATIKNLGVSGSVSSSSSYVGGIAAAAYSSSTITDCYFVGSVSGSSYVGGVVGYATSSTVTNCYNTGEVSGGSSLVGGVVGCADSSPITNCYNTGAVSSSDSSASGVGGVVGAASNSSHITNCYNTGEVSGVRKNIGGVAGYTSGLTLINCYNLGGVSGNSTGQSIGGVVGYIGSTSYVVNSYNQGVVGDGSYVGGVAGYLNSSNLINVYNSGEVSGSGSYVGGVIGYCYNSSIADSYCLEDSYSVGVGESDSSTGTTTEMEKDEMQSDDFAVTLTANATSLLDTYTTICGWTTTTGNYPSLQE